MITENKMSSNNDIIFSGIIAAYENEQYARQLYKSIDAQTFDKRKFEIVLVDDGSKDETLNLAREWQKSSDVNITIVSKSNGGVASARNCGIEYSKGKWLAFIDSDDILDQNYLKALYEFSLRDSHQSASMMTSRSILFLEDKGTTVDNHPLSWKYKQGDRLVSLNAEPHVVHLGGHSTIVRRSVVNEYEIRFRENIKPAFEDANFIGRYLSFFDEPILGLVAGARYFYRKRADGSSLIDTTWTRWEKFTHEPKYGHLGMLEELHGRLGYTPVWAQNMVLYSLYWYFLADKKWNSPFATVPQSVLDEFWESLECIFKYIDSSTMRNFGLTNYGWYLSEGILRHFKNEAWVKSVNPVVYQWGAVNKSSNSRKYVYSFSSTPPVEEIYVDNVLSDPISAKTIVHSSFGRALMYERIIEMPADNLVVIKIDGRYAQVVKLPAKNRLPSFATDIPDYLRLLSGSYTPSPQERLSRLRTEPRRSISAVFSTTQAWIAKSTEEAWVTDTHRFAAGLKIVERARKRRLRQRLLQNETKVDQRIVASAKSVDSAATYGESWIFMDRPSRADDNAEHLYRYVKNNHPEVNSWFMLERDSSDWNRLEEEGFRLISFGEESAIAPVLNAKFIISSHMDADIFDPISKRRFGSSPARRIFLQHGMNMNDISKWLNTKNITLMLTSSNGEYQDFIGDGGPYRITRSEVRLTGLPRHDNLVQLAMRAPVEDRSRILVVPTWRKNLSEQLQAAESPEIARTILCESDFYANWKGVFRSESIRNLSDMDNLSYTFVLHDHLAPYRDIFDFGKNVQIQTYSDMRVQDLLVTAKLVLTDYSSSATEAAIAGAAVVYYQPDLASIYDGGHSFRRGWFDYTYDGFGPVCKDLPELEQVVASIRNRLWKPEETYVKKLETSLPYLDGSVCQRVFSEMIGLD